MTVNPFDHEHDERLGAVLRECLDAGDPAPFAARIRSLVRGEADDSWEVLSHWWRPGIAAAVGFMLGVGVWVLLQRQPSIPIEEAFRPGDAPATLFNEQRPDAEVILDTVLEER